MTKPSPRNHDEATCPICRSVAEAKPKGAAEAWGLVVFVAFAVAAAAILFSLFGTIS